jgi:glycosyltransferase involved in cell wall biosynthesis
MEVSLIIPVRDEEKSVVSLLESLRCQTRPPEEVIITDGGSKDSTVEIIESYIRNGFPLKIKLIKTENSYPGRGRNLAIQKARYEWIAMTDAGIQLDNNWLKELILPLEDNADIDVVYGHYEPIIDSFFKECLAIVFVSPFQMINGKKIRTHFIPSSLIRRKVWQTVGGFPDFRAAEDRIFIEKVSRAGFKISYAPQAKVFWQIPENFKLAFKRFSLFSLHDLRAGKFRDWHYGVIRMYIIGTMLVVLGVLFSPLWFVVLALGILMRALKLIGQKISNESLFNIKNFKRLPLVLIIIFWLDLAMFWGALCFLAGQGAKRNSATI